MIADINITEKSFGPKTLMSSVKFSVDNGEKIGIVGRNGVGKSTLFGILTGTDKDYSGEVIYKNGTVVVATQQEHHDVGESTVLQYVLAGLPEYSKLSSIIETYPETMGDDMKMIDEYTQALMRFDDKGFYQIEETIECNCSEQIFTSDQILTTVEDGIEIFKQTNARCKRLCLFPRLDQLHIVH